MRPDGPTPAQMLRALPGIRRFAPSFLIDVAARYGEIVAFPVPGRAVFLAASPRAATDVLVTDPQAWSKDTAQYVGLSALTGAGLLTADGEGWMRRRRLLAPVFAKGGLALVAERSRAAAAEAAAQVRAAAGSGSAVLDVEELMLLASLDVVSTSAIDASGHGIAREHRAELVRAVMDGLDCVIDDVRVPQPLPRWVPTPRRARMARALRRLDAASSSLVAERRARPVEVDVPPDMLGTLLAAMDDPVDAMGPAQVRDELVTAVVAGHETVASSLTWTLGLLARHPAVQERVRQEALDVGVRASDDVLARLPYTSAVVAEGLRLYPPAWVISRRSVRATTVAGRPVPAGALAIVSPWQLHRDPAVWERADQFEPERFLGASQSPRGEYLPFGVGQRLCIGRDLALVESVVVLSTLVGSVRLSPAGPEPAPQALVTVRPRGGMPLRVSVEHVAV